MKIDELSEITEFLMPMELKKTQGVYFLFFDEHLQYIGSSVNIVARVGQHLEQKIFDSSKIINLNSIPRNPTERIPAMLLDIESALIKYYVPPINGTIVASLQSEKTKQIITIEQAVDLIRTYVSLNQDMPAIPDWVFSKTARRFIGDELEARGKVIMENFFAKLNDRMNNLEYTSRFKRRATLATN